MNVATKEGVQCPNCSKRFEIAEIINTDDAVLTCPFCQQQFNIHSSLHKEDEESKSDEWSWEAHGEPRKTILSSIKPHTDKPMIATFLLCIVVCLGIAASIVPGFLLETPTMVCSTVGAQGSIAINVDSVDELLIVNNSTAYIKIDEEKYSGEIKNTSMMFENIPVGTQQGTLFINIGQQQQSVKNKFFVIPFFTNAYQVSSVQQEGKLQIIHSGFGWCTSILLILSIICLIGMLSSWKRNHSDVALVGCLVGVFTIGFFFIGSLLSIIAFYLIYTSQDEFDDGKKGKSF